MSLSKAIFFLATLSFLATLDFQGLHVSSEAHLALVALEIATSPQRVEPLLLWPATEIPVEEELFAPQRDPGRLFYTISVPLIISRASSG